jgi:tetratricopeptide (TPR) repeat protein
LFLAALFSLTLLAQPKEPVYAEPPEEDERLVRPQEYTFNPLQAKKEMSTGDFYAKRGNYKAAAARYREATLWDQGWPEAYFKLGEASEKIKDYGAAREAYARFIELTPDKKKAEDARKRIAKLPKAQTADSNPPQALDGVPDLSRLPARNR